VNPERFYEPLPSGPHKGKTKLRADVDRDVKEYYRQIGWDERGIPTSEELRRLGLQSVDKKSRRSGRPLKLPTRQDRHVFLIPLRLLLLRIFDDGG